MRKISLIFVTLASTLLIGIGHVSAAEPGQAIKGSRPTVYYISGDFRRFTFPDQATFLSWYPDFSAVRTVDDAELASMSVAGIVPIHPGAHPVKFGDDPTVYGVSKGSILHWIRYEWLAYVIYGSDWSAKVVTLPASAKSGYTVGAAVTAKGQYWWKKELNAVSSIDEDLGVKPTARVIVSANIVNNHGGGATLADPVMFLDSARVWSDDGNFVAPGTHRLYHDVLPGYDATAWGGDCAADGSVTVQAGQSRFCTITFTDRLDGVYGSQDRHPPQLTILADLRGGTAKPSDAHFFIGGMQVATGWPSTISPGDYTLYRTDIPGYATSAWSGDCTPLGTITLRNGDQKICTVTYRHQ